MRKALVIGAGGQDGRLLTSLLRTRGYTVEGWVREESGDPSESRNRAVDLLAEDAVEREMEHLQPDEIYYLAAFHHSTEDAVELTPTELLRRSFDVHLVGLLNVLHSMKRCCTHARLFYAASSHIFGAGGEVPLTEATPPAPNSAYGLSKAAGMRACQLYRDEEGLFAATGILFNHESALRKGTFLSQKIVQGALRCRRDPSSTLTLGNLDARVDWGYAPDYVDAMTKILQLPDATDFVIASGEMHTVREFAEIAFGALGLDWRRHVRTNAAVLRKAPQALCGDPQKLRAATGWRPSMSFERMVQTLVAEASDAEPTSSMLSAEVLAA